ncbi:dTDP-4-dehydrorhamnose 3,5-epimerase [Hypericibacter adhaerens]|jgi:dTDP-4-dehydrorhamnose 3,5-epimerase|uniref:dTDP-4-dehydrorhamnose 3,5-epimerase n=1 Tax=Hypericibacter adhaerens TaxID=2602016 RepID=A0A5J6N405_9PROT|nr:dTDP-4-dehydrorhamnose 3,5-epimerase [Hypericibacter adhaerens]QEX23543.1 dTDP-4-dehydrorhamnose 3,5-epimerase [Hypericibacter adhaerens]
MIFQETGLAGAWLIEPEPQRDERGLFARTWSVAEFRERGLATAFDHCATSFNERPGTLRGLHYQTGGEPEIKLIRCTRGRIFDVIVDLRPGSATYRRWFATELTQDNRRLVYASAGFAHGFQSLEPASEVFYQITAGFRPELQRGLRWNDPALAIAWPAAASRVISARDQALPFLESAREAACTP